ncbi:MAG: alpha-amylase family glycosyl hydrolase [Phototrophicaceae bacterium]
MALQSNNPRIYEINTSVWLTALSQQYKTPNTLQNVPETIIDELASYNVDAIWLMGVWYRGESTRSSALNYVHEYRGALPDITNEDVIGSAYAVAAYDVEETLGGRDGLAIFRQQLHNRGLKLILDFIPNHTGLDHPWLLEHPEFYVQADPSWLKKAKGEFFELQIAKRTKAIFAHGRDPYFPGWIDTAQLNPYTQGYRNAAVKTLRDIATMADGVRCDMAMLMTNDVFKHSWGWLHPDMQAPQREFWDDVIPRVRKNNPEFVFIAEAYWNMNYQLLEQGFDYTYDKTLYDRIVRGDVNGIRSHLFADIDYLKRQIRFIENHDEPRAAESIGIAASRPAAVLISTLPGATLLHDGQFIGRNVKLPVHINRQPYERPHLALKDFYKRLLEEASDNIYHIGEWRLFNCYAACDGCMGDYNLLSYGWRNGDDMRLIVLNFSNEWSQGAIDLGAWADDLRGQDWVLLDTMHRTYIDENGDEMAQNGLFVDLEPHQAMIFHFEPLKLRKKRLGRRAAKA